MSLTLREKITASIVGPAVLLGAYVALFNPFPKYQIKPVQEIDINKDGKMDYVIAGQKKNHTPIVLIEWVDGRYVWKDSSGNMWTNAKPHELWWTCPPETGQTMQTYRVGNFDGDKNLDLIITKHFERKRHIDTVLSVVKHE